MRSAHTVEQVRDAEAVLMSRLPDGALMQRAATGLAHAVLEFLGDAVLGLIKGALPPHLCETAYMLALEVAMADARIATEEVKVLEVLRRTLHLDKLVAAALERGARARFQIG